MSSLHLERKEFQYKDIAPSLMAHFRYDIVYRLQMARACNRGSETRAYFIGKAHGIGFVLLMLTQDPGVVTRGLIFKGPEDEDDDEKDEEEARSSVLPS